MGVRCGGVSPNFLKHGDDGAFSFTVIGSAHQDLLGFLGAAELHTLIMGDVAQTSLYTRLAILIFRIVRLSFLQGSSLSRPRHSPPHMM